MASKANWLTPDFVVESNITVSFVLPDNPKLKRALMGALFLLADADNWNETGTATPENCATLFSDFIASYEES